MNVLVVDDDSTSRFTIAEMLIADEYEVFESDSGFSALEALDELDIDIILLDIMMPKMGGFETASKIRQLNKHKHVPIIYVTALNDSHRLSYGLTWGDDFLLKPVNQELLIDKININYKAFNADKKLRRTIRDMQVHSDQVHHEYAIVEEIFKKIVKNNIIDGNRIKYIVTPMSILSGDVVLCRCTPTKSYLLLGDFTGHGLPAAMGIVPTARIFFTMTEKSLSISAIAEEINEALLNYLPDYMFLAANLVEIDHINNTVKLWSGAMEDIIQTDELGKIRDFLPSKYMPLGVLDEEEFCSTPIQLHYKPGDKLYLYTDGLTEASNMDGELFGNERLKALFKDKETHLFQHIINSINQFTLGKDQDDDVSLVEISL